MIFILGKSLFLGRYVAISIGAARSGRSLETKCYTLTNWPLLLKLDIRGLRRINGLANFVYRGERRIMEEKEDEENNY